jgi:hypothetical protein
MITAEIKQDGETVCKITACKTDVKVSRSFAYKYKYKDLGIGEELEDHVLIHETFGPEQVIQKVLESVYG